MEVERELQVTKAWADRLEELGRILDRLRTYLEATCVRLRFHSVPDGAFDFRHTRIDGRVKPHTSVIRKLEEAQGLTVWDIDDLVGVRVVVDSWLDVEELTTAIEQDGRSGACPLDAILRVPYDRHTDGYKARHLKGKMGDVGCEIQIRTQLLDLWARISRADLYRRPDVEPLSLQAREVALELEKIDARLQDLRDEARRKREPKPEISPNPAEKEPRLPSGDANDQPR